MALHYIENEDLHLGALVKALRGARRSLWIATANVKRTAVDDGGRRGFAPVADLLAGLAREGVDVRVLHSRAPSAAFLESLGAAGAAGLPTLAMRLCRRSHMKALIVDGAWAYLGSANLTGSGLGAKAADRRNFEVGVTTDDGRLVARLGSLFSAIWNGTFCEECALRRKNRRTGRAECESPLAGPGI